MERSLELFADGHVIEREDDLPVKFCNTHGDTKALVRVLQFSQATTYRLATAASPPANLDIPEPRGAQRINAAGLKLITTFEGCELEAYQDSVDVWTIGYGHTKGVAKGMKITQAQAEQLLQEDLGEFEAAVTDAVSVTLNANQFSALVSFCFNLGPGSLFESTLLRYLNEGKYEAAANQFPRWDKAGEQRLLGLTRRRLAERALFLGKVWEPFHDYDKLTVSNPPLQGSFVKHVQENLKQAGFNLPISGIYDDTTRKVIQQFQQQHQLDADGVVGVETTKLLC